MTVQTTWFVGGATGDWRVREVRLTVGAPLPTVTAVSVLPPDGRPRPAAAWALAGVASHERYVHRPERTRLQAVQPTLGRPDSTRAALIPVRKSPAWWALTQDERRAIFEEQSAHIAVGLQYLPAIARKLYHSRDLGEPFDFLTWFEFAPADEPHFDAMLVRMRSAREWSFVDREIDVRLERSGAP